MGAYELLFPDSSCSEMYLEGKTLILASLIFQYGAELEEKNK